MSDVRGCASHLNDNIPRWLESLSVVRKRMAGQSCERTLAPGRQKTDSTHSIRPADKNNAVGRNVKTESSPTDQLPSTSLQTPVSTHPVRQQAKRKRQSTSTSSLSAPCRYRTKTMVIVEYDSEVQKSFEGLVRNIGSARNLLRKSKMAAKMDKLANMALNLGSALDDDEPDPLSSKLGPPNQPRIGFCSVRTTRAMGPTCVSADSEDFFDVTDKALEKAQGLCERAAHLHLREGNADSQIDQTVKKLNKVTSLCQTELDKLTDDGKLKPEEDGPALRASRAQPPPKALRFSMISLEVDEDESPVLQPSLPLTAQA